MTNTSDVAGTCVVQGYLAPPTTSADRPDRVLAGFASASIAAGSTATLRFTLADRSFQRWTDAGWVSTEGAHTLLLGTSSRSFFAELTVNR
ncbi:MAG: fibronectin type III-like domain-contianing protein [Acidimicrobiales bacterium]